MGTVCRSLRMTTRAWLRKVMSVVASGLGLPPEVPFRPTVYLPGLGSRDRDHQIGFPASVLGRQPEHQPAPPSHLSSALLSATLFSSHLLLPGQPGSARAHSDAQRSRWARGQISSYLSAVLQQVQKLPCQGVGKLEASLRCGACWYVCQQVYKRSFRALLLLALPI